MNKTPRGFTLLELLVVIGITSLVTVAAVRAYVEGIGFDERVRSGRVVEQSIRSLQDKITKLIHTAYVTSAADDTATNFIGDMGDGGPAGSGTLANRVVFTTFGEGIPSRVMDADGEFEDLNLEYGPQGGLEEVSLSLVPVGQPEVSQGLFLRRQRPPDGDPTQGGFEETLDPNVVDIQFEFYNGLAWQPNWDTRTMTTKRLPAAVRVSYQIDGESTMRVFVVRLPHSDTTPENPVGEAE